MFLFNSSKKTDFSDLELLQKHKEEDGNKWIGILLSRYTHILFSVCMKYLKSEEESKDAVLAIYEHLLDNIHLHEITHFQGWLHSVTRNHCLMQLRKQQSLRKKQDVYKKEVENFVEYEQDLHLNDKEEQLDKIPDALLQLKENQRVCIELFYLQNKSYKEIEKITGLDIKSIKSNIQNGKRNLKIKLTSTELLILLIIFQIIN